MSTETQQKAERAIAEAKRATAQAETLETNYKSLANDAKRYADAALSAKAAWADAATLAVTATAASQAAWEEWIYETSSANEANLAKLKDRAATAALAEDGRPPHVAKVTSVMLQEWIDEDAKAPQQHGASADSAGEDTGASGTDGETSGRM